LVSSLAEEHHITEFQGKKIECLPMVLCSCQEDQCTYPARRRLNAVSQMGSKAMDNDINANLVHHFDHNLSRYVELVKTFAEKPSDSSLEDVRKQRMVLDEISAMIRLYRLSTFSSQDLAMVAWGGGGGGFSGGGASGTW
jgi:hypothetical protein